MTAPRRLSEITGDLASGAITAVDLAARALEPDDLGATERLLEWAAGDAADSDHRRGSGSTLGPLDGIPFAVKANIDVRSVPTTSGTALAVGDAAADAAAVAAWRAAGLVPARIATLAELAVGSVTDNPHTGSCRNPHDRRLAAGGSSGGCGALVGAGIVPLALGSDTMGSVRIPAAYCGVVGWKPSRGAVDTAGLVALHPLLDSVGVLASDAAGLRAAGSLLSMGEGRATETGGLRVAVVRDLVELADEAGGAATAVVLDALVALGCSSGEVVLDLDLGLIRRRGLLICEADTYRRFAAEVDTDDPGISDRLRSLLRFGRDAGPERVADALASLGAIESSSLLAIDGCDVVIAPTTSHGPPPVGIELPNAADLVAWVNVAGFAAVSIPAGLPAEDGIRRGVQIIARQGEDALVLELADRVEQTMAGGSTIR